MALVGLDIGGANLKAADGCGRAVQVPFALWKAPDQLADEVGQLMDRFGAIDQVAVTMTGELCDCFESKAAGVLHILEAVQRASRVPIRVWTTAGLFVSRQHTAQHPLAAAAANWLALATYASRLAPNGTALLLDLGSTTCDITPIVDAHPQPFGRTDTARLTSGELVYCGVRRTPLCAVFGLTKAAEWFATTADAYVVLGALQEEPERTDTADGRPLTKAYARVRLARMECDEGTAWSWDQTLAFARQVRDLQVRRVAASVARVAARLPAPVSGVVLAGAGEFLLPAVLEVAGLGSALRISLAENLGQDLSTAACAHAVAVLAAEER